METDYNAIINKPFTQSEINCKSRNLSHYNLFCQHFYSDYMNSGKETKQEMMVYYSIASQEEFDLAEDDSVISEPEAKPQDVMKMAGQYWRNMSGNIQSAWQIWSRNVNNLPVLGRFVDLPFTL